VTFDLQNVGQMLRYDLDLQEGPGASKDVWLM